MNLHVTIRVSGKVQGVFYRASAYQKANELGVKGFVQNEKDGSVSMEAEGTDDQLQQLIEWCREGPPRAEVLSVDVIQGELKNFLFFEIRK